MKKTKTIFFLFIYCMLSIGMTFSTHFCGGNIASVQMLPIDLKKTTCGCEDTETPDDCCKTEIKSVQLNDAQIVFQSKQPSSPQTDIAFWAEASFENMYSSNVFHAIIPASSPPEFPRSYILHCTLLI